MSSAVITNTNEFLFNQEVKDKLSQVRNVIDIKFSTTSVVITEKTKTVELISEKQKIVTTYTALILYE
jgi:hypothetical protein